MHFNCEAGERYVCWERPKALRHKHIACDFEESSVDDVFEGEIVDSFPSNVVRAGLDDSHT
jgi:hypothetical protein